MSKHPLGGRRRSFICHSLYPLGFFLSGWAFFTPNPGAGELALAGAAIIAFVTAFSLLDIYRQLARVTRTLRPSATDESIHPTSKEELP